MTRKHKRYHESTMIVVFIAADALMLLLAYAAAVVLRSFFGGLRFSLYYDIVPFLSFILVIHAIFRLYDVVGLSPADEIRRIVYASSLVLLMSGFSSFYLRGGWQYSRAILLLFWFFSIGFVMAGRFFARTIGSKLETWGVPVVLLSDIPKGRELLEALLSNRKAGLKLVAYLTPDGESHPHESLITGPYSLAEKLRKELGVSTAIIVTTSLAGRNWIENVDQFCAKYSRVFLVSDLLGQRNLWIQPADIVGNLGLEISQNLDSWSARFLKDLMDISISFVAALFSLPLLGLIALAIKLDSKGHVFYSHDRIGKDGKRIRMLKFRTMYSDADERLEGLLDSDEVLSIEWDLYQKLKDDPRITHVGKWLRRWSLDELPQILNVVRREMSLIGPRPMTFGQEEKYGRDLNLYKKVRPGLTGLWQVSGRNLTTFEQRAMYDAYYVRNWSIWLDLYILAKTPLVIFRGEGVS